MPPADQGLLASYLQAVLEALPQPTPSPYCLIGALAVNAWGCLRATQDIDLLVLYQEATQAD